MMGRIMRVPASNLWCFIRILMMPQKNNLLLFGSKVHKKVRIQIYVNIRIVVVVANH